MFHVNIRNLSLPVQMLSICLPAIVRNVNLSVQHHCSLSGLRPVTSSQLFFPAIIHSKSLLSATIISTTHGGRGT